jgi:hypothetical protein
VFLLSKILKASLSSLMVSSSCYLILLALVLGLGLDLPILCSMSIIQIYIMSL